jgi:ribosomal protein S18 acetylase RimI-like enzyme
MRPTVTDEQLNALFAASWPHHKTCSFAAVLSRSLGWCGAYQRGQLVGFVYVAWDGGAHAFLLSPTVHPAHRRQGLGLALVRAATDMAAEAGSE